MAECDRRPVNQIARLDRHTRIVGGHPRTEFLHPADAFMAEDNREGHNPGAAIGDMRSEEHTYELQSLLRNSYDVFCLKKNTTIFVHTILRYTTNQINKQNELLYTY